MSLVTHSSGGADFGILFGWLTVWRFAHTMKKCFFGGAEMWNNRTAQKEWIDILPQKKWKKKRRKRILRLAGWVG